MALKRSKTVFCERRDKNERLADEKVKSVTNFLIKVSSALMSAFVLLASSSDVIFFTVVGAKIGAGLACALLPVGILSMESVR